MESTSSPSKSEESGETTLSYEQAEKSGTGKKGRGRGAVRGRGQGVVGLGGRGRGADSGRGKRVSRGVEGRGRAVSTRGRRKQRGERLQRTEADILEDLRKERKRKADDLIKSLDEEGAKRVLRMAADRNPSLLLDIAAAISAQDAGGDGSPEDESEVPSWCTCHRCKEMPTDRENVCCGMRPDLCSSVQPEMDLITDRLALHINMLYRNDVLALGDEGRDEAEKNRGYRHAAYRSYILHEYGRLTYQDRRVVPSCVVLVVRDKYADPQGQYTGFIPSL